MPSDISYIVDGNVHLARVAAPAARSDAGGWPSDWPEGRSLTVDDYRREMAAADVARAVLVTGIRTDGFDNSAVAHAVRRHPDLFAGVGNIDVFAPGMPDTMARWAEAGIVGFRLYGRGSTDAADWLDDPRAVDAWREAERLGAVVSAQRTRLNTLPALRAMLDRFPDVPLVIYSLADPPLNGGGGAHPALLEMAHWPAVHLNASPQNFQAATNPESPHARLLRALVERFGPSRIMWGSYSMFRDARSSGSAQPTLADLVEAARAAFGFLAPHERAAVLGGTAWSLYGSLAGKERPMN